MLKDVSIKAIILILMTIATFLPTQTQSSEPKEINMLYASIPKILTQKHRNDLNTLRDAGINAIAVKGYSLNEIQTKIVNFRSDPTLSRFELIIDISGILHDFWNLKLPNVCEKGSPYLPDEINSILKSITSLGLSNSFISGYYTFDEPAITISQTSKKGICKEFQELVYEKIRSLDRNKEKRPVLISNTFWSLSDEDIKQTMSSSAQDATFLEVYDGDIQILIETFKTLKRNNLHKNNYIYTLPAYNTTECISPNFNEQFQPSLEKSIKTVFGETPIPSLGISYFAYWPENKPDFEYSIDNCKEISTSTIEHLKNLPDLVITKISNSPQDFFPGDPVEFSVEIKNIGNRKLPTQWIGVLILIDDKCPTSGCMWGGLTSSLAIGETKKISINGNGSWRAEAGMHKITALVDDQRYAIEAKKSNNSLSRTTSIQDKPDLTPTDLYWSPSSPSTGTPLTLTVEVENIGNITTPNDWIGVLYTINGICPEAIGCQWGGANTSLAPGEKITIGTSQNLWTATPGTHQLGVLIDDQNKINESNENNNTTMTPITIK